VTAGGIVSVNLEINRLLDRWTPTNETAQILTVRTSSAVNTALLVPVAAVV
jgi:hypothetical protein